MLNTRSDWSMVLGFTFYTVNMFHNVKAHHLILSSSLRVTEEDSTATTMDALKARIRELERQILRGDRYKCLICMVSISFTPLMAARVPFVRRQKPADFVYRSADYRNASVSASSYISTWFSLLCSCLMNKALLPTNLANRILHILHY